MFKKLQNFIFLNHILIKKSAYVYSLMILCISKFHEKKVFNFFGTMIYRRARLRAFSIHRSKKETKTLNSLVSSSLYRLLTRSISLLIQSFPRNSACQIIIHKRAQGPVQLARTCIIRAHKCGHVARRMSVHVYHVSTQ